MKNVYINLLTLTILIYLATGSLYAQNSTEYCRTMEALNKRLQTDAAYASFYNKANAIQKRAQKAQIPCDGTNTVVIPLAFHFAPGIVTCDDAGCLLTEVLDQINKLNEAYGDNTGSAPEAACPAAYQDANGNSVASTGTCISFCLATPPVGNAQGLDPNCDPPITVGEFTGSFAVDGGSGAPGWDGILNIFIVGESECLGVADGLPGMANGDGISTCASAFGGADASTGCGLDTSTEYNLGSTTAHEIGHYLGLLHTHWDGMTPTCSDNDANPAGPFMVNDTPIQDAPMYGCPTSCSPSCTPGAFQPTANFMSYTDDACLGMFTQDQAMVMNYWANQLFGNSQPQCSNPTPTELPNACLNQPCPNMGMAFCDNPCFEEYNPNPGIDDMADATLCQTPIEPACGDETALNYDANATCIDNTVCMYEEDGSDIPTLSQWGLTTMALLLMCFGSISVAGFRKGIEVKSIK